MESLIHASLLVTVRSIYMLAEQIGSSTPPSLLLQLNLGLGGWAEDAVRELEDASTTEAGARFLRQRLKEPTGSLLAVEDGSVTCWRELTADEAAVLGPLMSSSELPEGLPGLHEVMDSSDVSYQVSVRGHVAWAPVTVEYNTLCSGYRGADGWARLCRAVLPISGVERDRWFCLTAT